MYVNQVYIGSSALTKKKKNEKKKNIYIYIQESGRGKHSHFHLWQGKVITNAHLWTSQR